MRPNNKTINSEYKKFKNILSKLIKETKIKYYKNKINEKGMLI